MFEWLQELWGSAEERWNDAIARWQAAVAEFQNAYQRHLDSWPMARDLNELPKWQELADKAGNVQAAVDTLADQLAQFTGWTKQTFGLNALQAIPLIPIAVITGSISAVVSITYALYSYNDELQRKWDYIKRNEEMLSPAEVANILEAGPENPLTAGVKEVSKLGAWIVIGGILIFAGPHILAAIQKGTRK